MMRDPSDGTVREQPKAEVEPPRDPLFAQIETALRAGKVKPERVSDQWVYQRAWNDGIDFALTQIARVEKEIGK
jgi:hypothetical protein